MSEIPELDDNYEPVRWSEPTRFDSVADKLNNPDVIARLFEIARGGIGEPDAQT